MTPPNLIAAVHEEHRARVENVAAAILRDREEARDIASEAFLAMLESGPRDDAAAVAWLVTTSRRRALNRLRDRARAARRDLRVADRPDAADDLPFDERIAGVVRAAFSRLSERDRLALTVRFVREEPLGAVAATLGCSSAAARVVVHRATRRLRREMVRALAEHHGVPAGCLDELTRRAESGGAIAHPNCGSCLPVADEVVALAAHGLIPIVSAPALRRLADAAERLAAGVRIPRPPATPGRLSEVAAAVVLSGAMALPSGAPADASVSRRDTAAAAHDTTALSARAAVAPAAIGAVARRAARRAGDAIDVVEHEDTRDDHRARPPALPVVGPLLSIADPLGTTSSYDITGVQIATTGDERGRPAAVVFRILLAGAPDPTGLYSVSWSFPGSPCTGVAQRFGRTEVSPASSSLSVACSWTPQDAAGLSEGSNWSHELRESRGASWVDLVVPFDGLPPQIASRFRPGAILDELRVETSRPMGGMTWSGADMAPDDGRRIRYTIAR